MFFAVQTFGEKLTFLVEVNRNRFLCVSAKFCIPRESPNILELYLDQMVSKPVVLKAPRSGGAMSTFCVYCACAQKTHCCTNRKLSTVDFSRKSSEPIKTELQQKKFLAANQTWRFPALKTK